MDINQLIAQNGACFYGIVFLWTFLEGETVVIFAGFAAAQGLVDPMLLLAAAWLGSFAGDHLIAHADTFSSVPSGAAFWYVNSNGIVEIAVNGGRADRAFGLAIGSEIRILA